MPGSSFLTTEQILALAPDAPSAKAGQGLANARQWVSLGRHEQAVWGECQGSGKSPYRTQIDLTEPAFRCTCPSRKFPCKHALGLFLLLANQPAAFTQQAAPDWVAEWLASRAKRTQQREEKITQKSEASVPAADPAAQAKRAAEREAKVRAGLNELERWLQDLVRGGLGAAQAQPPSFWERPAARLVDAQAPGVARWLREMAGLPSSGDGWQARLLERLGKLHLLLEGFKRIETLPLETQQDLRSLIGWTINQEELLTEPGVRDDWSVMGQRIESEDRLRVLRTWLQGSASGRAALVLNFAAGNQPLDVSLVPGTMIDAELVFYPGAYPLRTLIKQRYAPPAQFETMPGWASIIEASAAYAAALARHPWLERLPCALSAVVPARRGDRWSVRDEAGQLWPLASRFEQGWPLLALSGGRAVAVFGEWDGDYLLPLSAWAEGRFVNWG